MVKVLHFADAHIDMANYGRQDPDTGLPLRVLDFLKSFDTIVDAAIEEQVDLVIFAGDAYKDRNPAPTFQREWGRRIMRLANAKIPTILLVGNHDLSPAAGRAHALEEYTTLEVDNVLVADKPQFYKPEDLNGVPVQVLAFPWISHSRMIAYLDMQDLRPKNLSEQLEERITEILNDWLDNADPDLPIILTAHASILGAVYGGERTINLGRELVLTGNLVRNPKLDYVALGHIHKPQDLNEGQHPPVIYPGSIERVDFGEVQDKKFYIIAEVAKGKTSVDWRRLTDIRPFIDLHLELISDQNITQQITNVLPPPKKIKDAIIRLVLEYPRDWEPLIDDAAVMEITTQAFEFHFVKRPRLKTRSRIPEGKAIGSMPPEELLEMYWDSAHTKPRDQNELMNLAKDIISGVHRT